MTTSEDYILIIEDNPDASEILMRTLEFKGYTSQHATNGKEGLEAFKKQKPGMIFLDIMMPGMNGFEFLTHLQAEVGEANMPPIIIFSSAASPLMSSLPGVKRVVRKASMTLAELLPMVEEYMPKNDATSLAS